MTSWFLTLKVKETQRTCIRGSRSLEYTFKTSKNFIQRGFREVGYPTYFVQTVYKSGVNVRNNGSLCSENH